MKITKLQIEDEEEGEGGSADDDGEKGVHGDKKDGVWKTEPSQTIQAPPVVGYANGLQRMLIQLCSNLEMSLMVSVFKCPVFCFFNYV